ncbi:MULTISPECIES: hypothetical protein [unclassified Agrobacterium]|uniref:hypothetical protein n=1 Tax=unclassified Agrobacterium TaxID=2632611 RepID=UPI002448F3E3|nr:MULTISPECIES: hypothetical protein [unclassified Agrobacterium]MDH0613428.1 hypothetical protein [Agrobacterium sp. GD03872]MDH0697345.1 hypothetical protein [Agrobacterium sp. GD03871]MDH1060868.1 hypothetical protein [Agrobacterium sp. GD03992]MDH2211452.1 hypothetical protein [Agrobacterium sp. GD03643]MDH2220711.1 hypothetical protein [Agrobacterium sp. GD03638]
MEMDEEDEKPFIDSKWLTYDRLCRFLVIAEDVAGTDFRKFGILGAATRFAVELGMTVEAAHADIYRRYLSYRDIFELDQRAFIERIAVLRRQYGDERLRELYVLK